MSSSSLSTVESKLPPGFRFHPRDEELICDYLMNKIAGSESNQHPLLIEVDLNKCEPWEIPEVACVGGKEWYFYSQRDRKYATGLRTNRATLSGYWKATGKDRAVIRKGSLVGMRKTLVFYQGRAPKGRKSDWVMHEFRLEGPALTTLPQISSVKEDWVLCRVFHKNRELLAVAAKQGTDNSNIYHNDDTLSSSSLPQLMDPYITFDQTQPNNINMNELYYEQVPCFSIFNPNNNQNFSHSHHLPTTATPITTAYGGLPAEIGTYLNAAATSSSCDNKVIKAVLSHLSTKMEGNSSNAGHINNVVNVKGGGSPSFGEGSSVTSFLSEVGLTSMWNNY